MELKEIVMKLVGPINPIGETNADGRRFENLVTMCALVNDLVKEIDEVAYTNKDRSEFSMKRAGEYANKFLSKTLGIDQEG
jgi:hypothetical protein